MHDLADTIGYDEQRVDQAIEGYLCGRPVELSDGTATAPADSRVVADLDSFVRDDNWMRQLAGSKRIAQLGGRRGGLTTTAVGNGTTTFGDYELVEEIGRGGMGVVYKAWQRSASRAVALKLIRPDRLEGLSVEARMQAIQRFRTEAQAAAQLEHEHIVSVYEVGEIDDRPYYAMRFVDGESLADMLRDGPLEERQAAGYVTKVARAVFEAHSRNILHRDLKPQNVLVQRKSDSPLVADFGLAKLMQGGADLTSTGDVLGTPPYMSPEQARGLSLTAASDIYSLGATLYALLVGRPPFQAATPLETLQLVIHASVVPPRSLQPGLSLDVETICLKCLEKEPNKRYLSALEVACELERFLLGLPIEARPVGPLERGWRWCRRNWLVASLLVAIILILLGGVTVSSYLAVQAAMHSRLTIRHRYSALIQLAQATPADTRMRQELDVILADTELAKLTRFEYHFLSRLCSRELVRVTEPGQQRGMFSLAYSSDGSWLAWGWGKHVRTWNARTGEIIREYGAEKQSSAIVAISPDDCRLTTGKSDGSLCTWDVKTGEELWIAPEAHQGGINSIAYSLDGKWLASASNDGHVALWDAHSGRKLNSLQHDGRVYATAFSPDSQWLVAGTELGAVIARRIAALETRVLLSGPEEEVTCLAYSPDGRQLAAGSADRSVWIWNCQSGNLVQRLFGLRNKVTSVEFSGDGERLAAACIGTGTATNTTFSFASASRPAACKVWDAHTYQELVSLTPPPLSFAGDSVQLRLSIDGMYAVFSPSSNQLACGVVCLAGFSDSDVAHRLATERGQESGVSIGNWGSNPKSNAAILIWDTDPTPKPVSLKHHAKPASLCFSDKGEWLACGLDDAMVQCWPVSQLLDQKSILPEPRQFRPEPSGKCRLVQFSSDARTAATVVEGSRIRLWNAGTGRQIATFSGTDLSTITCLNLSSDGQWLAAGDSNGGLSIWNVERPQRKVTCRGHLAAITAAAFSADGRYLASGSQDTSVRIWDVRAGKPVCKFQGHNEQVVCVAWSSSGDYLATGASDDWINVWDIWTNSLRLTLGGHSGGVNGLTFFDHDERLAAAGQDGTLRIWDMVIGGELLSLKGNNALTTIAINQEGTLLATGSVDGNVYLWDARPLASN